MLETCSSSSLSFLEIHKRIANMPRNHSTHSRDLTLLKMASQGIPHPIICEEMGLTPETLKSALRRIRKQLKEGKVSTKG